MTMPPDLEAVLAFDRVMGITVVVAALEVALVSILAGLFAVLYNLTVGITGGVEATFTDAVWARAATPGASVPSEPSRYQPMPRPRSRNWSA